MARTKRVIYVTKDEVIDEIRGWKTGRKEDLEHAIIAIPATKVKRSKKLAMVSIDDSGEEWCPHCAKKLRFYDTLNQPPKYCYCMWCGGALERKKGNKNSVFDYDLIKGRPPVENIYEKMPTLPQVKFATAIARTLHIPMPKERTANTYSKFIKEHQTEYYHVINDRKAQRKYEQLSDIRGEIGTEGSNWSLRSILSQGKENKE